MPITHIDGLSGQEEALAVAEINGQYSFDEVGHVHKLGDYMLTGTSTVMSVLAKPLTWWASGMACGVLGWTNSKTTPSETRQNKAGEVLEQIKSLDTPSYLKLLDKAYKAHSEKLDSSAQEGTDMHAELEKYVKNTMENRMATYPDKIMPFIEWSTKNVKKFLWSELYCFSPSHLVGGITDCGAELNDGSVAIIDFKSSKEAYASHFFQIGGYDIQITENGGYTKDGKKIFKLDKPITKHIVVPFGATKVLPVVSLLVEENKQGFLSALSLYRILNKINNQ